MGRLNNKGRSLAAVLAAHDLPPLDRIADDLFVWQLSSMAEAVEQQQRSRKRYWPLRGEQQEAILAMGPRALNGDPVRLAAAMAQSHLLVESAIAADPRLARRSEWRRGEEGEFVCPALLSEGDDAPCFFRRRQVEARPNGTNPIRVVISTDDRQVAPGTAAAFIATVRLVQQWRPVEIWWQGAWLADGREAGYVFHVPLISGDIDFSRLEFCIADALRDNLSWSVMMVHACEKTHASWNGCSLQGQHSYLPDTQHFISHRGIAPTAESVAAHAAEWLDWGAIYELKAAELPPPLPKAEAALAHKTFASVFIDRTY
jgi:hypothetical protein